ncbi:hypothetical protein [Methylobacterium radiotolerans]|uniref:hypothetical protein n=1 Tax=Methylobacterium radiotolerans TaxID=31998 RepID=UPI0006AF2767|nr:hypothetical protein [Methylobacterium radiotolerans]MBE7246352.1 hypothetical protein [Actinomycetospora chiangmaiensis]UIY40229.1 hypothetical protein LZ599_17470 [Methylobacterium radiotolerans]
MTEQTGRPSREDPDAGATTATETPREKLGQMEDEARSGTDLGEAIDRATAAVGQDDGKR